MTRMAAEGIMTWMTGEGERMAGGMRIGGHHDAERRERIEGEEEGDPGKEGIWVPEEACSGMGKTKLRWQLLSKINKLQTIMLNVLCIHENPVI